MTVQDHARITAREFFDLPETTQPIELLDGEIIMSPSPVPQHQQIVFQLGKLIDNHKPSGHIFIAPLDVYLDERNVIQPDVMWVAAESRCKIGEKYLEGPPDLVVEVFSPGTVRKDKADKFHLYQHYGVREYWMVDPFEQYVDVHLLVNGKFLPQGVYGPEDHFNSMVLANQIELKLIFS